MAGTLDGPSWWLADRAHGKPGPHSDLFNQPPVGRFDGETYNHAQDGERLNAQLQRVRDLMKDGRWRTLSEIAAATHDPESSVSARLRDLRKERFGKHTVDRRRKSRGLYEYRLVA